jgi:hypothetical protein
MALQVTNAPRTSGHYSTVAQRRGEKYLEPMGQPCSAPAEGAVTLGACGLYLRHSVIAIRAPLRSRRTPDGNSTGPWNTGIASISSNSSNEAHCRPVGRFSFCGRSVEPGRARTRAEASRCQTQAGVIPHQSRQHFTTQSNLRIMSSGGSDAPVRTPRWARRRRTRCRRL